MSRINFLKNMKTIVKRLINKIKVYIPDFIFYPLLKVFIPVSVLQYDVNGKNTEMFGTLHFVNDLKFRYKNGDYITGIDCEGRYEEAFARMLVSKLDNGPFVDIGAASGFYSVIASKSISSEKIYSFEPDPFLRFILRKNNKDFCGNKMNIDARFVSSSSKGKKISLDDYCFTNKIRPSLIKMDIEGGEYEALLGMRRVCLEHRPVMLIEYHLRKLREFWKVDPCKIIEVLKSYNYSLRFNGHNWHLVQCLGKRDEFWHETVPNEINCAILAEPVEKAGKKVSTGIFL